jgi:hypothetical protein
VFRLTHIKIKTIFNNSSYGFDVATVNQCPHCGAFTQPYERAAAVLKLDGDYLIAVAFDVKCCSKNILSAYRADALPNTSVGQTQPTEYLCTYPNTFAAKVPAVVEEFSPRFAKLYNQCFTAEHLGHFELAASGYRNAMEILVKDYAIVKLDKPASEVSAKSLYGAIKEYMPSALLSNGANVVRIVGNDKTHYLDAHPDYTFENLKSYVEAFLHVMNATIMLTDFPDDLAARPQA